jgi:uncharacterized protein (TIGR02466 family)
MSEIKEHALFKDCIWTGSLGEIDIDALLLFIKSVKEVYPDGRSSSNRGGWRSHNLLANTEQFENYEEYLKLIAGVKNALVSGVKTSYDKDVTVTTASSWANIDVMYAHNVSHDHPGSVFSAMFYLTDENSPIVFPSTGTARHTFIGHAQADDIFESTFQYVPKKGDFIIFPSWVQHRVEPSTADYRISIALNFNATTDLEGTF